MKKKTVITMVLVGLFCLAGCRGMYEGFKSVKSEDCYRLPYPEQEQCLQQMDVSYEEYEKTREGMKRSE